MSGIIGIFYRDGRPLEPELLGRLMATLNHRGPDGSDVWHSGAVGLGHQLLWTTPESKLEHQPLTSRNHTHVLTADLRIDNRSELIAQLALTSSPSEPLTDSHLLLAAYDKWGDQCPRYLLGDFAFAIWDAQHQRLFCARDSMGVKPFYYYLNDRLFIFASEIKALLQHPEVPCELNEPMVADYLAKILYYCRKEDSFYRHIQELQATQSLVVTRERVVTQTYWEPDLSRELKFARDEDYVEAFREVFIHAVQCRLRSAFPVGSALSGGLDSSSVACVANQWMTHQGQAPLHTFSAVFPSLAADYPKSNERPYMEAVLRSQVFKPHFVHVDELSPFTDLERVFWHGEEPCPAPNLYMDWAVFKAAQEQGVRVLLTGSDGDTTITYGVQYLTELVSTFQWRKFIKAGTELARVRHKTRRRTFWQFGIEPLLPPLVKDWMERLQGKRRPPKGWDITTTLLDPEFAQRMQVLERVPDDRVLPGTSSAQQSRQEHWDDLHQGSVRYALQWLDKTAGAFGLEARHPFCDRTLIEFCLALPSGQKLHQGWTRSILRRGMEGILPPEVQWRRDKGDLSPNFRQKLLSEERDKLEQVALEELHSIKPYVNIPALQAAYHHYAQDPMNTDAEAVNLFVASSFALWLKQSGITLST